jgi:hypothetical protein
MALVLFAKLTDSATWSISNPAAVLQPLCHQLFGLFGHLSPRLSVGKHYGEQGSKIFRGFYEQGQDRLLKTHSEALIASSINARCHCLIQAPQDFGLNIVSNLLVESSKFEQAILTAFLF